MFTSMLAGIFALIGILIWGIHCIFTDIFPDLFESCKEGLHGIFLAIIIFIGMGLLGSFITFISKVITKKSPHNLINPTDENIKKQITQFQSSLKSDDVSISKNWPKNHFWECPMCHTYNDYPNYICRNCKLNYYKLCFWNNKIKK